MHNVMDGYRGLRMVVSLNGDRVFSLAVIVAALLAGGALMEALRPF